jgi:hypothetical protein
LEEEVVFGVVAVHVVGGGGGSGGDGIVCVVRSGGVVDRGWGRWSVCGVVVGGWRIWSAEMRAARVAASAVLRRVVKSAARVGGGRS